MILPDGTPSDSPGANGWLRRAALVATVAGAAGSAVFMFMVGRHNQSTVLMGLFTVWVLAPFAGLGIADRRSRNWPAAARTALQGVMLVVALGSLLIYGTVALGPPRPKPAAFFLMVPLDSWLLAVVTVVLVARASRRR
jgi:hypothetical protein